MFSRSGLEACGAVAMVTGVKRGLVMVLMFVMLLSAVINCRTLSRFSCPLKWRHIFQSVREPLALALRTLDDSIVCPERQRTSSRADSSVPGEQPLGIK